MINKNIYPSEALERMFAQGSLIYAFAEAMEKVVNTCNGPVDDLYEQVETVYAESTMLLKMLCDLTDREMIGAKDEDEAKQFGAFDIGRPLSVERP